MSGADEKITRPYAGLVRSTVLLDFRYVKTFLPGKTMQD